MSPPDARHTIARRSISVLMLATGLPIASVPANQQPGRHPDVRFIDQSLPATNTIRLSGPQGPTGLRLGPASATIGVEHGADHLLFNRINGVAITRAGHIVIMDSKLSELRVFDRSGKFVERIGRAGDGPGEFRNPAAMVVTPRDEILVVDLRRRLSTFVKGPEGYRISHTVTLPFGVQSMCYLRNELVAASRSERDSAVVAVLDATGAVKRRFGRLYTSPNAFVNALDGTPVWRTIIPDLTSNLLVPGIRPIVAREVQIR